MSAQIHAREYDETESRVNKRMSRHYVPHRSCCFPVPICMHSQEPLLHLSYVNSLFPLINRFSKLYMAYYSISIPRYFIVLQQMFVCSNFISITFG